MSIDFGGSCSGRVSKEMMKRFPGIENIIFRSSSWSDNKCGLIDGYFRESVSIETSDRYYNYVLDNNLFSGFVSSDRVDVANKTDCTKRSYKLAVIATTWNPDLFQNVDDKWILLSESDYEYLEGFSYDELYEEDDKVTIPKLWIPRHCDTDKETIFLVEARINKVESYVIFGVDQNGLTNVGYYNKESGDLKMYALSDVAVEEYLSAFQNADAVLSSTYDLDNYKQLYEFPRKIYLNFQSVEKSSANANDQKDDTPMESAYEFQQPKKDLSDLTMPVIPKLPLAEYKDKTLTFNGPYNHISQYLVRLTLHSLDLTSDDDLNNYYYNDDKLKNLKLKLVIPGTIRSVDPGAFFHKHFQSIVIEDGVTEICRSAFGDAQAESVILPETLTHIGENAFYENNISEIFIPKNVCFISGNMFSMCSCLKKIYVDDNNKSYRVGSDHKSLIENESSKLVVALKGSIIPEGVKIIGEGSFSWLLDDGELVIPNGVEIIENGAFSTCYYTNIVFPDTLLEIGDHVFWQCRNLKKLVFPKSLKHIGKYSFTLSSLEEVIIHANTEIGEGSFDSIKNWFLDSTDNTIKGTCKALSEQ